VDVEGRSAALTAAICIRCGVGKAGTFTPCAACAYDPTTDPDRRNQARALWLSDLHQKPDALQALGKKLQAGGPMAWDERVLDTLVVQLQTQQNALLVGKTPIGCSIFVWSLGGILIALIAAAIFLVSWQR
jgi:hypothetical protein